MAGSSLRIGRGVRQGAQGDIAMEDSRAVCETIHMSKCDEVKSFRRMFDMH